MWKNTPFIDAMNVPLFLEPMPTETVLESIYNKDGSITSEFYPKARSRFRRALGTAFHLYRYARGGSCWMLVVGAFQVAAFLWFGIEASGLDISADSIGYAKITSKSNFYCSNFENF